MKIKEKQNQYKTIERNAQLIDFMWLLEDGKAPDHSTLSQFRTGRYKDLVEGACQ